MRGRIPFFGNTPPGRITEDALKPPQSRHGALLALAALGAAIYWLLKNRSLDDDDTFE